MEARRHTEGKGMNKVLPFMLGVIITLAAWYMWPEETVVIGQGDAVICHSGAVSLTTGQGACSHHGGIKTRVTIQGADIGD